MRIIAFVVLLAGCGSVTTQNFLVANKDSEAGEVALDAGIEVGDDGGVDGEAHDGAIPDAVVGDGPWGGLHTVDVPAFRSDEPPMRGVWSMSAGSCGGTSNMTIAVTPTGTGWALTGTWSCGVSAGASGITTFSGPLSGTHDWSTDAVDLTLAGNGGGALRDAVLGLSNGGSGQFLLTGTLRGTDGNVPFRAAH